MRKKFLWQLLPYILLLAYIVFVGENLSFLKSHIDYIINYPVKISQEVREMSSRLLEMQNTLPGLLSSPNLSYNDKVNVLNIQEDAQDESFKIVKNLFDGEGQYIKNLEIAFSKIRALRREVTWSLANNDDYNKSMALYKEKIAPQVKVVNERLNDLYAYAQRLLEEKKHEIGQQIFINIIITIIVGLIIALLFYWVNRKDKKKTRELEARDTLFNRLSQNVDEIFINAANSNVFNYVTYNSERLIHINSGELRSSPHLLFDILPADKAEWLHNILDGDSGDQESEHSDSVELDGKIFKINVYAIGATKEEEKGYIIAINDQTKDFQHQQDLSDALANANAASVAKSSFLSHMSHEIRTPMNAIIGMTTIALSKLENPERVEDCLQKIGQSSRHLLRLINDVLDMSKIENGKLSINHETFNLPKSISNLNDLVRPQAESRQLQFEITQEGVEDEEFVGDALRLNQILINILSNSLKFTARGGTIALKIQQVSKNDSIVRLRFIITDTGIGMSKEFLKRIYKPFEQATLSTTAVYGGTGLGMSITFNLITLMGGTINVDSIEGKGSTFTVELPFGFNKHASNNSKTLPHLKILVVDDDYATCEHASLLLQKMGLTAHWTTNGNEAVKMVQEAHAAGADYDVCLIDWKMPNLNGGEITRRMRQAVGENMMVIMTSAYDWVPIEEEARAAGVNDFVAKPFFASTLYNALLAVAQRSGAVSVSPEPVDSEYDFTGKRILLVEDNEFNREIGQEFLDMVHATVENAKNGQEAVDKFKASVDGYYDLILMDVQMPVMNGYEATRAIRALERPDAVTVPILAMTANAFSEDVANAVAAGMNGHIAKPIDVNELYRLASTHMEKKADAAH